MDLVGTLQALDFTPIVKYLNAFDLLSLSQSTRSFHHDLSEKPGKFWAQLALASGYPYRLAVGDAGRYAPTRYLHDTHGLRLRFMRHPARHFALHPSARFQDLIGPALSCIQRRSASAPMFLVRTGVGYGRLRAVRDRRLRIADLTAPGDLIQVMPTSAVFLVYDRGPDTTGGSGDVIVEMGGAAPPVAALAVPAPDPDPMADLFPHLTRYLHRGRTWSLLFNQPDGPPSRPMHWIDDVRRPERRRAFVMRAQPRANMTPTFEDVERYLRRRDGERRRPCPDPCLYPGLRAALDPDPGLDHCYVHIWWSYGRYWYQLSLHPVNRRHWAVPIAAYPTLDALFRDLEQLRFVD